MCAHHSLSQFKVYTLCVHLSKLKLSNISPECDTCKHTHWGRDLLSCLSLEKIRYRGSTRKFDQVWGSFVDGITLSDIVDET